MNVRPLIKKDFERASSVGELRMSIIYQLKRRPSKIKVSIEFLIGSSKAKAWPVILVSERQKGREGYLSPSVIKKVTPAWIKGAALSFCQSSWSMATFAKRKTWGIVLATKWASLEVSKEGLQWSRENGCQNSLPKTQWGSRAQGLAHLKSPERRKEPPRGKEKINHCHEAKKKSILPWGVEKINHRREAKKSIPPWGAPTRPNKKSPWGAAIRPSKVSPCGAVITSKWPFWTKEPKHGKQVDEKWQLYEQTCQRLPWGNFNASKWPFGTKEPKHGK